MVEAMPAFSTTASNSRLVPATQLDSSGVLISFILRSASKGSPTLIFAMPMLFFSFFSRTTFFASATMSI